MTQTATRFWWEWPAPAPPEYPRPHLTDLRFLEAIGGPLDGARIASCYGRPEVAVLDDRGRPSADFRPMPRGGWYAAIRHAGRWYYRWLPCR